MKNRNKKKKKKYYNLKTKGDFVWNGHGEKWDFFWGVSETMQVRNLQKSGVSVEPKFLDCWG